ncbi:hypothetical protein BGX21_005377, partial [Mortierella sp. AD011]
MDVMSIVDPQLVVAGIVSIYLLEPHAPRRADYLAPASQEEVAVIAITGVMTTTANVISFTTAAIAK